MKIRDYLSLAGGFLMVLGVGLLLLALVILIARAFGAVHVPVTRAEMPAGLIGTGTIAAGIVMMCLCRKRKQ